VLLHNKGSAIAGKPAPGAGLQIFGGISSSTTSAKSGTVPSGAVFCDDFAAKIGAWQ